LIHARSTVERTHTHNNHDIFSWNSPPLSSPLHAVPADNYISSPPITSCCINVYNLLIESV